MSTTRPADGPATSIPGQVEETIFSRLRNIEQRNVRLQRANFALVAGLVLTLFVAVAAFARAGRLPAEIEASRYVLRDDAGIARGSWAVMPEGGTALSLHDRNGVSRVKLTLLPEGFPGIALTDGRGLSRAVFGLLPDGTATAAFADPSGNTRAVLGVAADETAHLVFVDGGGQTRVSLGTAADGEPGFVLYEETARTGPAEVGNGEPD